MSQIDSRESLEYQFAKHVWYRAEAEAKYRRQQKKLESKERVRDKQMREHFMSAYNGYLLEFVYALSQISSEPIKQDKTDRDLVTLYTMYKQHCHKPWGIFASKDGFLIKNAFIAIDHGFAFIDQKENSIYISESGLLFIKEAYLFIDKKNKSRIEYIKNRELVYGGHKRLFKVIADISAQPFQACNVTYDLKPAWKIFRAEGKMPTTLKGQIDGLDIYALFRATAYGFADLNEEKNSICITPRGSEFLSYLDRFNGWD
jgi:hypothetical protein